MTLRARIARGNLRLLAIAIGGSLVLVGSGPASAQDGRASSPFPIEEIHGPCDGLHVRRTDLADAVDRLEKEARKGRVAEERIDAVDGGGAVRLSVAARAVAPGARRDFDPAAVDVDVALEGRAADVFPGAWGDARRVSLGLLGEKVSRIPTPREIGPVEEQPHPIRVPLRAPCEELTFTAPFERDADGEAAPVEGHDDLLKLPPRRPNGATLPTRKLLQFTCLALRDRVSAETSTVTVVSKVPPAGGSAPFLVTIIVRDECGRPLRSRNVRVVLDCGGYTAAVSATETGVKGEMQAVLPAPPCGGTCTIRVYVYEVLRRPYGLPLLHGKLGKYGVWTLISTQPSVTFLDVTAPVPDVDLLPVVLGECTAAIMEAPTATDPCSGIVTGTVQSVAPSIGATTLPLVFAGPDTYTVTWAFNDGAGHVSTQTQTVVVTDTAAPTITLLGANPDTVECHASYADPGASASDGCAGDLTEDIGIASTLDVSAPGTYTVTYSVSDPSGRTASVTRTVNVTDTAAPVPDMAPLPMVTGDCRAEITAAPTATDACAGAVVGTVQGVAPSIGATTLPLVFNGQGTYTVTWAYDDGDGRVSTQTQTVMVMVADTTAPVIFTCPPAQLAGIDAEGGAFVPDLTTLTAAHDDCATSVTITQSPAAGARVLGCGTHEIVITATDPSANTTTCSVDLIVFEHLWQRNTFPGPGHKATVEAGPWGPGEGTDRGEYVTCFGVSPLDRNFMLMGCDVSGLVVARDGKSFVATELPVNNVSHLSFDPIDAGTAYVWARPAYHDVGVPDGRSGWWRTVDRGRTWSLMLQEGNGAFGIPGLSGALNLRHRRPLVVDPVLHSGQRHIWVGTVGNGLLRSTDGGECFAEVGPPDFAGKTIRTLSMAADGSALYAISCDTPESPSVPADMQGELWVFKAGVWVHRSANRPVEDVEVSPVDPSSGFLVQTGETLSVLRRFTDYGATRGTPFGTLEGATLTGHLVGDPQHVRINPWNPRHVVVARRGARLPYLMQWSEDGGDTWRRWDAPECGVMTNFTDYSPLNHRRWPDYGYALAAPDETFSSQDDAAYEPAAGTERDRWPDIFSFIPGEPASFATWGPTQGIKGPLLTKDHGATLRPFAHGGTFKRATQIALAATDTAIAIGRVEYGVVATGDGGASWRGSSIINQSMATPTAWPDGTPPRDYRSRTGWGVAISPSGMTLVAVVGDQVDMWGDAPVHPTRPAAILRSEDGGRTWRRVASASAKTQVFWHRQRPEVVYAGGLVSVDGGEQWSELASARPVLAMSPVDGDLIVLQESRPTDSQPRLTLSLSLYGPETVEDESLTMIEALPVDAYEDTLVQQGGLVAIDPACDPKMNGGRWRLLVAGTEGVYVYEGGGARDEYGVLVGSWSTPGLGSGFVSIPKHDDDVRPVVCYLNKVAFDPRPGFQSRVYAAGGGYTLETTTSDFTPRGVLYPWLRGSAPERQVYRSDDAGLNWKRISGGCFAGLPDYADIQALAVSADTGRVFVSTWAGLYVLDPDAAATAAHGLGWTAGPATPCGE